MNEDFPFGHFINLDSLNNNNNLPQENLNKQLLKENFPKNNVESSSSFTKIELDFICEEILEGIKASISPHKYKAFFENVFKINFIDESKIIFSVTTAFIKKMIEQHYLDEIKQIMFNTLGRDYTIEITTINSKSESAKDIIGAFLNEQAAPIEPTQNTPKKTSFSFKLNDEPVSSPEEIKNEIESAELKHNNHDNYRKIKFDESKTFDNFVVGPSNNMAHAFTYAVAKDPGKVYPQLYLHGNSGLGKTHLLHAICNYTINNNPYMRICFTTANEFMSEMVMAIQGTTGQDNKISEFRRKYTELVDILIIDDIHELKNKTRTQSELFYIFNQLQSKGKQLIFTSDKPPKEIVGIEDRIRTRLSSALLIDIQQPDLETRIAILKKKAKEKDIFLDDDVINLIASCVKTNVRELEGKLVKLGAYSDLMKVDIDLEIAKEQLNLSEDMDEKTLSIDVITKSVASYFKLALGDIKGKSRKKEVALARHIAMFMGHKILKKTLEEIGEYFDNRDHSTVIHGIKKIQNRLKDDAKLSQQIYEIESRL